MLPRVIHRLIEEQRLYFPECLQVLRGHTFLEGFVRLKMMDDPFNVFVLGEETDGDFQTHLLDRGEVVTTAHDTTLDKLLASHGLELREGLFIFERFVGFEIVPGENLTVAIEIELG